MGKQTITGDLAQESLGLLITDGMGQQSGGWALRQSGEDDLGRHSNNDSQT